MNKVGEEEEVESDIEDKNVVNELHSVEDPWDEWSDIANVHVWDQVHQLEDLYLLARKLI